MNRTEWMSKNVRKAVTLAAVIGVAALVLHGIVGSDGLFTYQQKRSEYATLQARIKQQKKENAELQEEVQKLRSDPATIEWYAREELHMSRQDEFIYETPPARSSPPVKHPQSQPAP